MKKRLFSFLLALCLVLALLPAAALAADPGGTTDDGLHWQIENGTLTISGTGAMQDYESVNVGSMYQPRYASDAPWADYRDSILAVVVAEGVTTVSANAFRGLAAETAQLPGTLTEIGDYAFSGSMGYRPLRSVNLPEGLKRIGRNAFTLTNLETVTIPGTVEFIGSYAFAHTEQMKELIFAEGFRTWENVDNEPQAFCQMYQLEIVRFPSTLTGLPENAFDFCGPITDVYYNGTEEAWNALAEGFSDSTKLFLLEKNNTTVHFVEIDPMDEITDVSPTAWYYDSVAYCVRSGLMIGTGEGVFSPGEGLTRAMVVTVLWRLSGEPEAESKSTFVDLKHDWYIPAVTWAQEVGVVNGTDPTHFAPGENISRQDFVTILCRFLAAAGGKIHVTDLDRFPDSGAVSAYAVTPMQWAVAEGIINGSTDNGVTILDPKGTTTRAQAAAIFMRFCETEFEFEAD